MKHRIYAPKPYDDVRVLLSSTPVHKPFYCRKCRKPVKYSLKFRMTGCEDCKIFF